jgi:hypothetical protein
MALDNRQVIQHPFIVILTFTNFEAPSGDSYENFVTLVFSKTIKYRQKFVELT